MRNVKDGSLVAYVIWRGGGKLIIWYGGPDDFSWRPGTIDLATDVVATKELVGTSTYLVDRPWVNNLERQCARHGRTVTVN